MASATKKAKIRRILNLAKAAKKRKNFEKKFGSTPKLLPLDMPNANEKAMKKAE
ncbi:MAG: hypothetical protein HYW48_04435 [Deltaproteobacteria bacterium]|nr:hypothetical protein [Deltaproteobacteria bacterium]